MRTPLSLATATVLALSATAATAAVDFTQLEISEPLTPAEIETALGVTGTFRVDGVALGPGDDLFIAHRNGVSALTIARIDPITNAVPLQRSAAQIATDLGAPFSSAFILEAEFTWDPNADVLYFVDNSTTAVPPFEYALIAMNGTTGAATTVLRSATIEGWNSHGVLSNGWLIGTLGEDFTGGEPVTGLLDPAAPSFLPLFDEDAYKAAAGLGPTDEAPPESIAVHPTNDDTYVFCHDSLELFLIQNPATSESLTHLIIPGWNGVVDFHGLAVDEDGNLYGFDEAAESIRIWNGTTTFEVPLDDIATALAKPGTPPFAVTLWRGMKARKIGTNQSEVWLASNSPDYGVVRLLFGNGAASAGNWSMYE